MPRGNYKTNRSSSAQVVAGISIGVNIAQWATVLRVQNENANLIAACNAWAEAHADAVQAATSWQTIARQRERERNAANNTVRVTRQSIRVLTDTLIQERANAQQTIADRDATITVQAATITEQAATLVERDVMLVDQAAEIAELRAELARRPSVPAEQQN